MMEENNIYKHTISRAVRSMLVLQSIVFSPLNCPYHVLRKTPFTFFATSNALNISLERVRAMMNARLSGLRCKVMYFFAANAAIN